MTLTPDEVDYLHSLVTANGNQTVFAQGELERTFQTLRAYAEIVEAVAGFPLEHIDDHDSWFYCPFCCTSGAYEIDHQPDCIYVKAREVRGKK